jgi:NAD(P)-dependent dehydrogenase (short-subunit alcohol dehydrogenase family)
MTREEHSVSARRVVLITGASRGIGRAIALHLAGAGYRVFGTSRGPLEEGDLPFELLPLDVGDEESVRRCVRAVLERAGRIDVLVNNVGHMLVGAAEETSEGELQHEFTANFFGAARVIRAAVPHMRAAGGGTIISMSSIGGLLATPYTSAYSASKHALEGYSEALRYELAPFGISVSLVEPGPVKTQTVDRSVRQVASPVADYEEARSRVFQALGPEARQGGVEEAAIAAVVARIIAERRPRLRYAVGRQAALLPLVKGLLPHRTFEDFVRRQFRLDAR